MLKTGWFGEILGVSMPVELLGEIVLGVGLEVWRLMMGENVGKAKTWAGVMAFVVVNALFEVAEAVVVGNAQESKCTIGADFARSFGADEVKREGGLPVGVVGVEGLA